MLGRLPILLYTHRFRPRPSRNATEQYFPDVHLTLTEKSQFAILLVKLRKMIADCNCLRLNILPLSDCSPRFYFRFPPKSMIPIDRRGEGELTISKPPEIVRQQPATENVPFCETCHDPL